MVWVKAAMAVSLPFIFSHPYFVNKELWHFGQTYQQCQNMQKDPHDRESREA